MKKFLIIILLAFISLPVHATKTMVEITPVKKITTSDDKLMEGDYVYFKDIKTGEQIQGLITDLKPNGFTGQEASVTITQFQAIDSNNKYEGSITIKGDEHKGVMSFYQWFIGSLGELIRGGEVHIRPNKDVFTIWRL